MILRCLLIVFVSVYAFRPAAFTQRRALPADTIVTGMHQITVKGEKIPYRSATGTQPVWDKNDKVIASVHYTYYERTDIQDNSSRPLIISFNGGPGSASVWMHLAYTGPYLLNIDDEGYPLQPYGVRENPHSVLDVADIVYVNPVNTGYSRIIGEETERKLFFGVEADIRYLAEWISTFVTRNNRWRSPKYLIGESYGTTRVSGLALELQNTQWMYLNGVILVSPTDLGIARNGAIEAANRLPYFTAAAWYHKVLPPELLEKDLEEALEEAEDFTIYELIPALAKGGFLTEDQKKEITAKMSYYSGLKEDILLEHNLNVSNAAFWKYLLKSNGFNIGRLDSRYLGIDKMEAGTHPDYSAELTSWLHSFTPAVNYYFSQVLNFKTDVKYNMFGPVHPWDRGNDNTGENLRQAMAQNPFLKVMIQSGYYDGATTYFNAKYTMWNIDPSGKMKDRFRFEGYRSGHMMYLRKEDLASSNEHIREFIRESLPDNKTPAKY